MKTLREIELEPNADPLTGEPGSHPIGTGVGATSGAVAGAAVGAVIGGPLGAAVGGAIGAVAGGAAGHSVGESLNPTVESVYWEGRFRARPYYEVGRTFGDYEPAYRQYFTGNASAPRARLLAAGGFDLRYRRNEDVELAYRMRLDGIRFVFDADAAAYHYAERSFRSWLRNAHEYGVNDVMFAREHAEAGLLERTRREFATRLRLVRWTTRACVDRAWLVHVS